MDEFLALSRLLTGLESLKTVDPLAVESRMAADYLRLMKDQFGAGFNALLAIYRNVLTASDPLAALINDPGFAGDAEMAAKQIVNMWLLSQYGGGVGKLPDQDAGFFEKGFVWPEIKAHPIGFSHLNYGYWSSKP
jgi:hypothetical protein